MREIEIEREYQEKLTEQINCQAIAKNQADNKSQWQNQAIAIDMYWAHTDTHSQIHTPTHSKWSCFGLLKRSLSLGRGCWGREPETHPFRQTCDMLLPLFVSRSVEMSMQLSFSSSVVVVVVTVTIPVVCRMHHQFSVCPVGDSHGVKGVKEYELCTQLLHLLLMSYRHWKLKCNKRTQYLSAKSRGESREGDWIKGFLVIW